MARPAHLLLQQLRGMVQQWSLRLSTCGKGPPAWKVFLLTQSILRCSWDMQGSLETVATESSLMAMAG